MALFTAYFVLVAISDSMPLLIATQVARAVALAVVGALGITYVQDLLPHATGRATTLFANTPTTGSLISGILAGATAQALGYRAAPLLCGVLAAVGGVLFAAARQSVPSADRRRGRAHQDRHPVQARGGHEGSRRL